MNEPFSQSAKAFNLWRDENPYPRRETGLPIGMDMRAGKLCAGFHGGQSRESIQSELSEATEHNHEDSIPPIRASSWILEFYSTSPLA